MDRRIEGEHGQVLFDLSLNVVACAHTRYRYRALGLGITQIAFAIGRRSSSIRGVVNRPGLIAFVKVRVLVHFERPYDTRTGFPSVAWLRFSGERARR